MVTNLGKCKHIFGVGCYEIKPKKTIIMDDFSKLIAGEKPTLVDFFATWCGPCKVQGPILEDVKGKVGDAANIIKIDIDKNQELAMRYNVRSVPTLIMFKLGTAVWRAVGVQSADELVRKIKEHEHTKKDETKVDPA